MALQIVVGIVAFLASYALILGVPPIDIGLIIIFGLLYKHFLLYGGLTAAMIAFSCFVRARWSLAVAVLIAAAGLAMSFKVGRSDDIAVHMWLAMFVAGVTTICVLGAKLAGSRGGPRAQQNG